MPTVRRLVRCLVAPAAAALAACGPVPDPARSTVAIDGTDVVADGTDTVTITVTLLDEEGRPVPEIPVSVAASGSANALAQAAAASDGAGVVVATLRSTAAETKTLSVTAGAGDDAVVLAQRPAVQFLPRIAGLGFARQPVDVVAGTEMTPAVQVAIQDPDGRPVERAANTVTLRIVPPAGEPPAPRTAAAEGGVATFSGLSFERAGAGWRLVASVAGLDDAESEPFEVKPAAATHLRVETGAESVEAGETFSVVVTALDAFENTATGYDGIVTFLCAECGATLPDPEAFVAADRGVRTFAGVVLKKAGSRTLSARDTATESIAGSATIAVQPAATRLFSLAGLPAATVAGAGHRVTLTARDVYDNTTPAYRGRVRFASSDGAAVLPAEVQFVESDAGVHGCTDELSLRTAGTQSVAAADADDAAVAGQIQTAVAPAATAKLLVSGLGSAVVAGTQSALLITAADPFGNTTPSYTGTVGVGSTDPLAVLPSPCVFAAADAGTRACGSLELRSAGAPTVTALDILVPTVRWTASVTVTHAAAEALAFVQGPPNAKVRRAVEPPVVVEVQDRFGNRVASSTDHVAVSPVPDTELHGTRRVPAVAGTATYSDLVIDDDGTYQLTAAAAGLPSATSGRFWVADDLAPDAVTDFAVTARTMSSVTLSWTATGDDGRLGRATLQQLRFSDDMLADLLFALAFEMVGQDFPIGAPRAAGDRESVTVTGLAPGTDYAFALRVMDNATHQRVAVVRASTTANTCPAGYFGDGCTDCDRGYHHPADAPAQCVDACAESNPCTEQRGAYCRDIDTLVTHAPAPGLCIPTPGDYLDHACDYGEAAVSCAGAGQVCLGSACRPDPCTPNPCAAVQPPRCLDAYRLEAPQSRCFPSPESPWYGCQTATPVVDCALAGKLCLDGACSTVASPAPGDLAFTEVMTRPADGAAAKTWIELRNVSGHPLDLAGLSLEEVSGGKSTLLRRGAGEPLPLAAGDYFVVGGSTDLAQNGGAAVDVAWDAAFALPASHVGRLRLSVPGPEPLVLADMAYDFSTAAFPAGRSAALSSLLLAGQAWRNPAWWCASSAALAGGGFGTPGAASDVSCGATVLAAMPAAPACVMLAPASATFLGAVGLDVRARIRIEGATTVTADRNDWYPHLAVELGYGDSATDASLWRWITAAACSPDYDGSQAGYDEYVAHLHVPTRIDNASAFYGFRMRLLAPDGAAASDWVYCDRAGVVAATPPTSAAWGAATVRTTAAQIAALRAGTPTVADPLPLGGVVTYAKPYYGADLPGFFVQGEPAAPAAWVQVDPTRTDPPLQKGDVVEMDVVAREVDPNSGIMTVTGIENLARRARRAAVDALAQDLTETGSLGAKVIQSADSYAGRLVTLTGTVGGAFAGAGAPYRAADISWMGKAADDSTVRLRVSPAALEDSDIASGCTFRLRPTPLWWYTATTAPYATVAQPSAWEGADLELVSCPDPLTIRSASVVGPSTIVVQFSRSLDPRSATLDRFITGNVPYTAAAVSGRRVTLTSSRPFAPGELFGLFVHSVTDRLGVALSYTSALMLSGISALATLRITEFNSNVVVSAGGTYNADLIELEVLTAGNVKDIVVAQDVYAASPTTLTVLPDLEVAAGDRIVVHLRPAPAWAIVSEAATRNDCQAAGTEAWAKCYPNAWDLAATTANHITHSHRVLVVKAPDGTIQDAVPLTTGSSTPYTTFGDDVRHAQRLGLWTPADCGGAQCSPSTAMGVAVNVASPTALATNGSNSASLIAGTAGNRKEDWSVGPASWGQANP